MGSMARGFAVGSLILVILYVVSQEGPSQKTEAGANALIRGMRRLFSPHVAGIGDHSKEAGLAPSSIEGGHSKRPTAVDEESLTGKLFT